MIEEQIKNEEQKFKEIFLDLSEQTKKCDEEIGIIISFLNKPHLSTPEMLGEYGMKLVNIFDTLGDLLSKIELQRKNLHDILENLRSVFMIEERMKKQPEKVTEKYLETLTLANQDLFNLEIRYNSLEALTNYTSRKRDTIWEYIQLVKKIAEYKSTLAQVNL